MNFYQNYLIIKNVGKLHRTLGVNDDCINKALRVGFVVMKVDKQDLKGKDNIINYGDMALRVKTI